MAERLTRRGLNRNASVDDAARVLRHGELAHALELVGDRWTLLILRDAFLGVRRFEEWRRRTGASPATLTSRLRQLCTHGLLKRTRTHYRLTALGLALYPVALSLWRWETKWRLEFDLPRKLVHSLCGHTLRPTLECRYCGNEVSLTSVHFELHAERCTTKKPAPSRRRRENLQRRAGVDTHIFHAIDTVGDRWTMLIVAALMLGLHRHDEIEVALGIATNILADRLRRLELTKVVDRKPYCERPRRYAYRLTASGRAFFPLVMALQDFGGNGRKGKPSLALRHLECGRLLGADTVCRACGDPVRPREVSLTPAHGRDILHA